MPPPLQRKRPLDGKRRRRRRRRQATSEGEADYNATDDYYYNYDNFNFYTGEAGEDGDDYVEQCLDFYTGEYSDCPDEEESESSGNRNKDEDDDKSDADSYPPEIWCDLVGTLNNKCGEYSLLEIWSYDRERISKLTQQGRNSIE